MSWLGWYGDDFTGATDTLGVAATAGLRTRLFLRIPSAERLAEAGPLDAIGIAGAARAMAPDAMAAELAPVGRFFAGIGCRIVHYKCCSTFDSAPGTGSLGAAVRALKPFCPNPFVPILGGQPSLGRYCAFSTLFAAGGQGGEVVRIDRHPTMSRHPVTPMGEGDLRLHLRAQGIEVVGLHLPAYASGDASLAADIRAAREGSPDAVLFDVTEHDHLVRLGRLIRQAAEEAPLLAVGASSVVQALTADLASGTPADAPVAPADGPVFVLVGSLSPVTRRQVEASTSYDHLPIDPATLVADPSGIEEAARRVLDRLSTGAHVMATTALPGERGTNQAEAGRVATATALFAARVLGEGRLRRAAFAGGDTSSYATLGLGLDSLSFMATLSRGVALCRTHAADPVLDGIELALKGGQMGPPDLFETLVYGRP